MSAFRDLFISKHSKIPLIFNDVEGETVYKREKLLGEGAFAKCYEISKMQTNEKYACKVLFRKKQQQENSIANELRIHEILVHPSIVRFHSSFSDPLRCYLVMELCSDQSLLALMSARKKLKEPECCYFMRQIVQGVKYIHESSIVHRDLKLGNIFLNDLLRVKIGDFGLATHVADFIYEPKGRLCGTPEYFAPEMLNAHAYTFEVDIWSIGCMLYALLVGRVPFKSRDRELLFAQIKYGEYR